MNWHERYLQQAGWTRDLRDYLFRRCNLDGARRVLEVGCGTGAVLKDLPAGGPQVHGLDVSISNLRLCRQNAPAARLACGDARALPYARGSFEITFCHYLLLWIPNPVDALVEMKRVTASSGYVIAFAEPDYGSRQDQPAELEWLGQRQNEALERQGANLRSGIELAGLFHRAGIPVTEAGKIRSLRHQAPNDPDWEREWQVLEADLAGAIAPDHMARIKEVDRRARALGRRMLNVPTYFAWGQV
jgi:SAM-dependent methyltransferase